jgi:hypothetical protein
VIQFGGIGDQPVPADYFGQGRAQIAVFCPSTGQWFLRAEDGSAEEILWGALGDLPVPGHYALP